MNREIKFRIWDNTNKEFSNWTNRDPFFSVSHGSIFFWERTRKEDGSYDGDIILSDTNGRFILQQFTGLKDSTGKDIYEGDIVEFSRWNCPVPHPNIEDYLCNGLKKIIFGLEHGQYPNAGFCAISISPADLEDGHTLNCMNSPHMKIIGNIFDNPELVK